jgi:hypothetical protein
LADPPKKKPNYPPPEQSSTVGTFGQHHTDSGGPPKSSQPPAPVAAPEVPKVEAEPPAPLAAPERFDVHPESTPSGSNSAAGTGLAPITAVPMGPPPTGFLPDHPFVSGIVAGLIGTDLGSKLYGGPMMGDNDGVMIGFILRIAAILLLAWLVYRVIANRASSRGETPFADAPRGRREPSFKSGTDAGGGRREPTLDRNSR